MMTHTLRVAFLGILTVACTGTPPNGDQPQPPAVAPASTVPDPAGLAAKLVESAQVRPGELVRVLGGGRDLALLEEIALAVMKVGGHPLITVSGERFQRRAFDEVPAKWDTLSSGWQGALAAVAKVEISVDAVETQTAQAGIPAERLATRNEAGRVASEAYGRSVRVVNIGNSLYPTDDLASRFGMSRADLASMFWKAVAVTPTAIRAASGPLRAAIDGAEVTLTSTNGTDLRFRVIRGGVSLSDGALPAAPRTADSMAPATWLPAGELFAQIVPGSGEGHVVVDRYVYLGAVITNLRMTFAGGRLTAMVATSGLDLLQKLFDAGTGGKDLLGTIDIGVNPEARFPIGGGHVYPSSGGINLVIGNNSEFGGSTGASFDIVVPVPAATLSVGGKRVIDAGVLR